jgi:hypothetical protein
MQGRPLIVRDDHDFRDTRLRLRRTNVQDRIRQIRQILSEYDHPRQLPLILPGLFQSNFANSLS